MGESLPMFPLGSVIFPFTAVPLRVFEPRFLTLLDRVLDDGSGFGTVLIEQGFEVGGGDRRFDVGTRLEVIGVGDLADGHRAVVVAGTGRIAIERWLPDDPHPWAEVVDHPDGDPIPTDVELAAVRRDLERLLAIVSELGEDTAAVDLDVSEDPAIASYQMAAITPVTPLDAYRLLTAADAARRVEESNRMIVEQIELLIASLAGP